MKAISARSRAYSLVEVVITMALVILLSAGGYASALVAGQIQAKASQTVECTAAAEEALSVMEDVGRFAKGTQGQSDRVTVIVTKFAKSFAFAFRCGEPSQANLESSESWSQTLLSEYDEGSLVRGVQARFTAESALYEYDYTDGKLHLTVRLQFGAASGGTDTYAIRSECGKASAVKHTGVIA